MTCHSVNLEYSNRKFRVTSRDNDVLVWLVEFLCPQFHIAESEKFDVEIHYELNDHEFDQLMGKQPKKRELLAAFILDTRVEYCINWSKRQDCRVLFDYRNGIFFIINSKQPKVQVLVHSSKSTDPRTALMRVVREILIHNLDSADSSLVHSAAFLYKKSGIMIAGPKNAGKTSLLIHCLKANGSYYISNDRVFVCRLEDKFHLKGMPTVITISRETVNLFRYLREAIKSEHYHHAYSTREILAGKFKPRDNNRSVYTLNQRQFCAATGTQAASGGLLSAILFPIISKHSDDFSVTRIGFELAREHLNESELARDSAQVSSEFNILANPNRSGSYYRLASSIARTVPCFELKIGSRAYKDKEFDHRYLASLLDGNWHEFALERPHF